MNKKIFLNNSIPNDYFGNFSEVLDEFNKEEVIYEASRCLKCKNKPCQNNGCPLNNNIPEINKLTSEGKFMEAFKIYESTSPFPSICSRVCSAEKQCEGSCTLGINKKNKPILISQIEKFLASQNYLTTNNIKKLNKKIAVIGSGPSAMAAAFNLLNQGYNVEMFEKSALPGGILTYGIPDFVLPNNLVMDEFEKMKKLGLKIFLNHSINNLEELKNYDAVFLGLGCEKPRVMNIPGEKLAGVYLFDEYLKVVNEDIIMKKRHEKYEDIYNAKKVIVVGGGNTSIDVDRIALRLGAKSVINLYRRSQEEMPASKKDYEYAISEGVNFNFLTNPIEIIAANASNKVSKIKCINMRLGDIDSSGRRSFVPLEGSETYYDCDLVVLCLGSIMDDKLISKHSNLNKNKWGLIDVDPITNETSIKGVFAGGDSARGSMTVVHAIKDGLNAAKYIDKYIKENL